MRKHQAGPPPTLKPSAPTTSPMELGAQRERWETFRKRRDQRCKGAANFLPDILGQGHYTRGCPCGEVHWSPPTCASWVAAAGCARGSSSTTDSGSLLLLGARASAGFTAPEPALHGSRSRCSAQRFHASALRWAGVRGFALQSLGKARYYIGWWQSSMVATEEHKALQNVHRGALSPLPRMRRDLHKGSGRGGPSVLVELLCEGGLSLDC